MIRLQDSDVLVGAGPQPSIDGDDNRRIPDGQVTRGGVVNTQAEALKTSASRLEVVGVLLAVPLSEFVFPDVLDDAIHC